MVTVNQYTGPDDDSRFQPDATDKTVWVPPYRADAFNIVSRDEFDTVAEQLTTFAVEAIAHGVLTWDANVDYVHPAVVLASDGDLYFSVQNSKNVDLYLVRLVHCTKEGVNSSII